jgi:hypothetical protein
VVCAGCGATVSPGGTDTAATGASEPVVQSVVPDAGEQPVFPMKAFSGMSKVATGAYAPPSALPFAVDYPRSAGAPMGVYVSIRADYPSGEAEIVEEYDSSSTYGPFRVREKEVPAGLVDQSFINQIPGICTTSCKGSLVTLEPGVVGALLAGPNGPTSVTWLQGQFEMIVIGPVDTFTADTAVAIAKEVATGFNPTTATRKSSADGH